MVGNSYKGMAKWVKELYHIVYALFQDSMTYQNHLFFHQFNIFLFQKMINYV